MNQTIALLFLKTDYSILTNYNSISSFLEHSSKDTFYNIYFCYENLTDDDRLFF